MVCSSVVLAITLGESNGAFNSYSAGSLACLIYSLFYGIFVVSLCTMHTYLIITGQTTYDLLRPLPRADKRRPHIRTAMRSFAALYARVTPSMIREFYSDDGIQSRDKESLAVDVSPQDFVSVKGVTLHSPSIPEAVSGNEQNNSGVAQLHESLQDTPNDSVAEVSIDAILRSTDKEGLKRSEIEVEGGKSIHADAYSETDDQNNVKNPAQTLNEEELATQVSMA